MDSADATVPTSVLSPSHLQNAHAYDRRHYTRRNRRVAWGRLINLNDAPATAIDLVEDEYVLGRARHADIVVEDCLNCSKEHCKIMLIGDMPCLQDMSANGTLLDGKEVKSTKASLTNGCEIEIKMDKFFVFLSLLQSHPDPILENQIISNRYYLLASKTLGSGSFATVKLAVDLKTGERLACKVIPRSGSSGATRSAKTHGEASGHLPSTWQNIQRETAILKNVTHPNIVQVKHVVSTASTVHILLTRVSGGELFDHICSDRVIAEHEAKFMFYQILLAVKYLHDLDITHRDIKPENILMESRDPLTRLLVSDFGLAKMLGTSLERMRTKCGTFTYLAPEVLNRSTNSGYSKAVDCWSLGVVLYTMLSKYLPFGDDHNPTKLGQRIQAADYNFDDEVWSTISQEAIDLIGRLLEVEPQKRLTIDQALAHPWINNQKVLLKKLYRKMLAKSNLPITCTGDGNSPDFNDDGAGTGWSEMATRRSNGTVGSRKRTRENDLTY
ncbi:Checkpoint kinase 2 [Geranomyces variabilis]|nr:Checkpoint kinase 2 [Geranomyces variabilis]